MLESQTGGGSHATFTINLRGFLECSNLGENIKKSLKRITASVLNLPDRKIKCDKFGSVLSRFFCDKYAFF